MDFTRRPMVNVRGPIKSWRLRCAVLLPRIHQAGAPTYLGWSMPTTCSPPQPRVCPHSNALLGNCLLCFLFRKESLQSHRWWTIFNVIGRCGREPGLPYFVRLSEIVNLLISTESQPRNVDQPGQQFLLSSRDIPLTTESRKLAPQYIGPF